jgi:hypothetical protein
MPRCSLQKTIHWRTIAREPEKLRAGSDLEGVFMRKALDKCVCLVEEARKKYSPARVHFKPHHKINIPFPKIFVSFK